MATLVRNRHATPVTLPYPYSGVLAGGAAVVLSGSKATVEGNMGKSALAVFDFRDVPDHDLTNSPVDGTYEPPPGAKLFALANPAAKGTTDVAAAIAANAVSNAFVVVSPAVPRNLRVTFAASWDGGDVTVQGTDQSGAAISEVFTTGSGVTRVGTKVFKTVTSAAKGATGATANTASIGTGDKLGIGIDATGAILFANGINEAVTIDAANLAFTPTTLANGSTTYNLLLNVVTNRGS